MEAALETIASLLDAYVDQAGLKQNMIWKHIEPDDDTYVRIFVESLDYEPSLTWKVRRYEDTPTFMEGSNNHENWLITFDVTTGLWRLYHDSYTSNTRNLLLTVSRARHLIRRMHRINIMGIG